MFKLPPNREAAALGSRSALAGGFVLNAAGFFLYGFIFEDISRLQEKERFIIYSLIIGLMLNIARLIARSGRSALIEALGRKMPKDVTIVAPESFHSADERVRRLGLRYWHGQLAMHFMVGTWAWWIIGFFYLFFTKGAE